MNRKRNFYLTTKEKILPNMNNNSYVYSIESNDWLQQSYHLNSKNNLSRINNNHDNHSFLFTNSSISCNHYLDNSVKFSNGVNLSKSFEKYVHTIHHSIGKKLLLKDEKFIIFF